ETDQIILSFSAAVPAFGEDRLDLLATMAAPPRLRGEVRAPGRFGYELLGSLRIGVIGHPYLGPTFYRRKLPTTRAEEFVSEDARNSVGLEKVLHGRYERDVLS